MAVLSVMAIEGDPDSLVARMQQTLDPIAGRKASKYGGISSTVVRTENGIKVFNLWKTEEGRHRMADDPEIREAVRDAGFPPPAFKGYEVLALRSTGDTYKQAARRFADDVWSKGDLRALDELVAEDFVGGDPVTGEIKGREGMRAVVQMYRSAFPDTKMTVDLQVAEGDWVATFWTARGTHKGELMGTPASGREVTVTGVVFDRFENGVIVESRALFDGLGLLQQIGAIPAGAPAGAPA
jgi:steroid delta-isomerase-like uncharacterized protein